MKIKFKMRIYFMDFVIRRNLAYSTSEVAKLEDTYYNVVYIYRYQMNGGRGRKIIIKNFVKEL